MFGIGNSKDICFFSVHFNFVLAFETVHDWQDRSFDNNWNDYANMPDDSHAHAIGDDNSVSVSAWAHVKIVQQFYRN